MNEATATEIRRRPTAPEIASWILAALALFLVLHLHLLSALLGGLAVYELVHILSRKLPFIRGRRDAGKGLAVALLAVFIVAALVLAVVGVIAFFRSDAGSLPALLGQMADILETSKEHLPIWLASEIPANADELKNDGVAWLREHAGELQSFGAQIGRTFIHALIGMVIGAMISLHEVAARQVPRAAGDGDGRARPPARRGIPAHRVRPGSHLGAQHGADRHLPGRGAPPARRPAPAGQDPDRLDLPHRPAAGARQPDLEHGHRRRQPRPTRWAPRSAR